MTVNADEDDKPASQTQTRVKTASVDADDDDQPVSQVQTKATSQEADEDDASKGMVESFNVEQAWVENEVFLTGSMDDSFSKGHNLDLEMEWEVAVDKVWGLELDFPELLAARPLGTEPAALGPIEVSIRRIYGEFGTEDSPMSGVFSVRAGGNYWWGTTDDRVHYGGNGINLEALGAFRLQNFFLQGLYGYNLDLDQSALSGWVADTALGCLLGRRWVVQFEADFSSNAVVDADDGISSGQWSFIPQFGFKTGEWYVSVGEELNVLSVGSTVLLLEHDL